ncbi:Uma2 family endonuclease [Streptomyces sp. NPDC057426]|uniref:Uma2 family endonuclease n=1 Tax=Streptomyces sp. NPDC057426 TaxID=3346128 RepID=UPI0036A6DE74
MALPIPGDEFPEGEPDREGASVQETFELFSAEAPKGWRVELIEGEIYVVPPANGQHEEIVSELSGQFRDHDKRTGRYTGIGLYLPGASDPIHVIPDLVIAPKGSFDDQQEWHSPEPVLLVAEVTSSSTAARDRDLKIRGYARAGIAVYLLIDREAGEAVVCSDPEDDDYTRKSAHRLGLSVPLPHPLGFALDTSEF